jgi:hypothetical protein
MNAPGGNIYQIFESSNGAWVRVKVRVRGKVKVKV